MTTTAARRLHRDVAFELSRTLPAKPRAVWRAWTDEEALLRWWGPKGFPPTHCDLDLREGGRFHYGLQVPDGDVMWGCWDIEGIEPGRLLTFLSCFSDPSGGGPTRHPWEPDWPLWLHTAIRFSEVDDGTELDVTWIPVDATAAEVLRFARGHEDCRAGWTGTLDQLADYLEETAS